MSALLLWLVTLQLPSPGQAPTPQLLNNQTEEEYDRIIDRFIQFDIGRLGVLEGARAQQEFNRLDARAVPALIRGLNKAANIEASCPVVVLSNKLRGLLSFVDDVKVVDYGLRTLGADVRQNYHTDMLRGVHGDLQQRRVALEVGRLHERQARDLLVRQLYSKSPGQVQSALKHQNSDVRWAATRVVAARGWEFGAELIDLAGDEEVEVRAAARSALNRLSRGFDFGPRPDAGPDEILAAQKQWRTWWEAGEMGLALPKADAAKQEALLAKLRDSKGAYFTQALADALPHLSAPFRAKAQDALTERLGRMTAATLRDRLKDTNWEVRRSAALAFILKEDSSAIPDLIPLLRDNEQPVVRAAHQALKTLSGQDFGPAAGANPTERAAAAQKWRDWWRTKGS